MAVSTQHVATPWRLDNLTAELSYDALRALVDVAHPRRGLAGIRYGGVSLDGWLLGVDVEAPAAPDDVYVRGGDLVVVYHESADRPFSVQVYWSAGRGTPLADALVLDATISIQTRQWEAFPRATVTSRLARGERIAIDGAATVLRPAEVEWSYVEVVPAEDFVAGVLPEGNATGSSVWSFNGQFMERGVIRRLRVRGAIVPRASDLEAAVRLRTQLLAEQPPLTA